MHIQKRAINHKVTNGYIKNSSIPMEQKIHKCWRRFMNERAIDRAYIPTTHGRLFSLC
jgi:hypothetical protein